MLALNSVSMCYDIINFLLPHLSALFAAAFGGFSGAFVAFLLERRRREMEEKKSKISAALRAHLILIGYIETLENLNRQYLDPLRNDPQRNHKLTSSFISPVHLKLDLDSLSFLAEHRKPQVFHDIHLAQRAYYSAIDALDVRNSWLEKFLGSEVKLLGYNRDTEQAYIAADPRSVKVLTDLTDSLYKATDLAIEKCNSAIKSLSSTIKELFPGEVTLTHEIK